MKKRKAGKRKVWKVKLHCYHSFRKPWTWTAKIPDATVDPDELFLTDKIAIAHARRVAKAHNAEVEIV